MQNPPPRHPDGRCTLKAQTQTTPLRFETLHNFKELVVDDGLVGELDLDLCEGPATTFPSVAARW